MVSVLIKALSFLAIIALGYFLKSIRLFGENDHKVLSKIVMTITLPATVIHISADFERGAALFYLVLSGFVCSFLPVLAVFLLSMRRNKSTRVFSMLNMAGYNIGCFALPFIQSFFGAQGAALAMMFDMGNAIMVTGGSYALTSTLMKTDGTVKETPKSVLKKFVTSVPFDAYMLVLLLTSLNIRLPDAIITITGPMANANSFIAMLYIGMMFRINRQPGKLHDVRSVLVLRFLFGALFSAFFYFCTPFPLLMRQVLAILPFSPVSSLAPMNTERCHEDASLASFCNSLSIIISLIAITCLALMMGLTAQ